MKKIYLFICLFAFWKADAQISITSADMPTPGDMPRSSLADSMSLANITYSNTGANFTWDYSTLTPDFQRVDTFVTAPVNYILSFGSATVSRRLPINPGQGGGGGGPGGISIQSGYEFFRTTTSKFERLGYGGIVSGSPFPLSLVNNPKDIVYVLPLQYGSKDTSVSKAILDVTGFAYVEQNQIRYNDVDGWGSITTPYGTFDCMRIASSTVGYDSISYNGLNFGNDRPPRTDYKWLGKGEVVPLLQISTNTPPMGGGELVSSATYRDSLRSNVPMVGIEKGMDNVSVRTYPNPTTDYVHFDWNEQLGANAECRIFDAAGKEVFSQKLFQNQVLDLNVQIWEAGTYFVKIGGDKKQYTGKLLIEK